MASAFQNVDARDRLMEEYKVWEANHPQVSEWVIKWIFYRGNFEHAKCSY